MCIKKEKKEESRDTRLSQMRFRENISNDEDRGSDNYCQF